MKARCWFEEEPRVDFIRNIAPWDADDLDADRSRGLRLDPERPLIKVLLMAASGRTEPAAISQLYLTREWTRKGNMNTTTTYQSYVAHSERSMIKSACT